MFLLHLLVSPSVTFELKLFQKCKVLYSQKQNCGIFPVGQLVSLLAKAESGKVHERRKLFMDNLPFLIIFIVTKLWCVIPVGQSVNL